MEFTTTELESEQWRDVIGYGGIYEVSNLGRVRAGFHIMTPQLHRNGYRYLILSLDGKPQTATEVHRIVAKAWIPNPETKPMVDHIIGGAHKTNNRVSNLRWATKSENARNRITRSEYKGTRWCKDSNKWKATIRCEGETINLGSFHDRVEAYFHYCAAAVFYHGEFAHG
jgi:hypothetical protein